jgi:hypothetical protein
MVVEGEKLGQWRIPGFPFSHQFKEVRRLKVHFFDTNLPGYFFF